jgi:hypothetical protein
MQHSISDIRYQFADQHVIKHKILPQQRTIIWTYFCTSNEKNNDNGQVTAHEDVHSIKIAFKQSSGMKCVISL